MDGNIFGSAVKKVEITIPDDFETKNEIIKLLGNNVKKVTFEYTNLFNATDRIVPGEKYLMEVVPVKDYVSNEDCLAFYKQQGALLVGPNGVLAGWDHVKKHFPDGNSMFTSLDQKQALWEDEDAIKRLLFMRRAVRDVWKSYLCYFGDGIGPETRLLMFYKK